MKAYVDTQDSFHKLGTHCTSNSCGTDCFVQFVRYAMLALAHLKSNFYSSSFETLTHFEDTSDVFFCLHLTKISLFAFCVAGWEGYLVLR